MLGHQSDLIYACTKLLVIAMATEDVQRTIKRAGERMGYSAFNEKQFRIIVDRRRTPGCLRMSYNWAWEITLLSRSALDI